jgi:glycosyltransferase involved in cell wall biosynthesis
MSYLSEANRRGIPVVYTLHEYMLLCPRGGQMLRANMEVCEQPIPEVCAECIQHQIIGEAPIDEGRAPLSSRIARHLPQSLKERLKAWVEPEPPNHEPALVPSSDSLRASAIADRLATIQSELQNVDLFLSPSEFLRNKFIDTGMIAADRITCSHNGQEEAPFVGIVRDESHSLRVGYIGTIADFKGVDVLVEAFNRLSDLESLEGHIHGSLTTFEGFSGAMKQQCLNPRVQFHGRYPPSEVGHILSKLDVLVVPSRWYENAPLTIQEAFLSGIPVVASRLGGMAEFVHDEENGLLFNVGDPADLARCLRRLHDDRDLLRRLRPTVKTHKSIESDAHTMELRYRELIAARASMKAAAHKDEQEA